MTVRALAGVPIAALQANQIEFFTFVKFDFPAPTGTKRWTDRPGGFTGSIDGGPQTWTESYLQTGGLQQSRDDVQVVSWVEFENLDYAWTALASVIRDTVVTVYSAWFNPTDHTLYGSIKIFEGRADEVILGQTARIALRPHRTNWAASIPPGVSGPTCIWVSLYKDTGTCQYAGAEPVGETTCHGTRKNCVDRGNQVHFTGFDLTPKPGEVLHWRYLA